MSARKEGSWSSRLTVPSMTSAPNRYVTIWAAYRLAHPELVELVVSECWVRVDAETDRIGDIGVFLVGNRSGLARPERVS